MKFDITVIFKNKEDLRSSVIKKQHKSIFLDLEFNEFEKDYTFGNYFIKDTKRVSEEVKNFLNIPECDVNLVLNDFGSDFRRFNFIVEVYVSNQKWEGSLRKKKIESILA